MSYIPLHNLPLQFQDPVTSVNMSAGKIEFFLAGTSTPVNLFSDDAGTSIGSSITLNSGGFPESGGNVITLYRDSDIAYKLVLKNAAGSEISTSNPIPSTRVAPYYEKTAAETSAGVTPSDYSYPQGHIKRYGALMAGATESSALTSALAVQAINGGDVYIPEGTFRDGLTRSTWPANVGLRGAGMLQTTVLLTASISTYLQQTDGVGTEFRDITIDVNNNVSVYAVNLVTPESCAVRRMTVRNWSTGLRVASTSVKAAKNTVFEDISVTDPATVSAGFAISASSTTAGQLLENIRFIRCTAIGNPGAYSAGNDKTADQIVMQGVKRGWLTDCLSLHGGENGFSITRLCEDIKIDGCHAEGCDADGFAIGSGFVKVTVADASNFAVSDTLTQTTGSQAGVNGSIQAISGNIVYVNSTTNGRFQVGETVSDGSDTSTITAIERTNHIAVNNCTAKNNGIDANAVGSILPGFLAQQADYVIFGSGNFSYDTNTVKLQDYGVYLSQSDNILIGTDNDFDQNLSGAIGEAGDITYLPSTAHKFATPLADSQIIVSGVITAYRSNHRVDTESAAASDDLDTINGGTDGMKLILRATSAARTVVVKDGTGNLRLTGGADFSLDHSDDRIELEYSGANSAWIESSRSDVST